MRRRNRRQIYIINILPIIIFVIVGFMGIVFGNVNNITGTIAGTVESIVQTGVFITDIELYDSNGVDLINTQINTFSGRMVNSRVTLSDTDGSSYVTYKVKIYNSTEYNFEIKEIEYDVNFYDNSNIECVIDTDTSGLNEYIGPRSFKDVYITYRYKNGTFASNNTLNSYISIYGETPNPVLTVSPENVENYCKNTELTITAEDKSLSGLSDTNSYQYYFSTSSTEPVGGEWNDYVNGEPLTVGDDLTGTYYLFVKQVEDNLGKLTEVTNGTYHVYGTYKFDNTEPTITLTSSSTTDETSMTQATLSASLTDENSGISKIEWYYKSSSDTNYTSAMEEFTPMNGNTAGDTSTTKTKLLTNLTAGTTYNAYVVVSDVAGNSATSDVITFKTKIEVTYNVRIDPDVVYTEYKEPGEDVLTYSFTPHLNSEYTFFGWREDSTASSDVLTSKVAGTTSMTLYAVFKRTITVTYYNNTTTAATKTGIRYHNNGNNLYPTFTIAQASKSGWTARGWSEDTAGDGSVKYSSISDKQIGADITLYGLYYRTVTVTYYNNTTTAATKTGTAYYNSAGNTTNPTFTIAQASKSGWAARGWSYDTTGNASVKYSSISSTEIPGSVTLYGLYQRTVTVTYYNNTTTAATKTGTAYYNSAGNTTNPTFTIAQAAKSGWTARGWSTATTGNASVTYSSISSTEIPGSVTLYGLYQKTITVSYNGNGSTGGSTSSHTGTVYYNSAGNTTGAAFTLKTNGFTKTNYDFTKWAEGSATGTQYAAGTSRTLTDNKTYYAIWGIAYIYNAGTGLYSGFDLQYGLHGYGWEGKATISIGSSYVDMSIKATSGSTAEHNISGAIVTKNTFDLTNYTKLKIVVDCNTSTCKDGNYWLGPSFGVGDVSSNGRS